VPKSLLEQGHQPKAENTPLGWAMELVNGKCHDFKRKGVCRRGQKGKENPQQQTWSQKVFKKRN